MSKVNSKYYANQLSLKHPQRDLWIDRLWISLLNATIDMNPHQIDWALFYFNNPLSRWVILADEVWLWKTIEAWIILCQLWSEMKRNIILIVPATLRKQWVNELHDKFHLPAVIIDWPIYREMKEKWVENPFDQDAIIVCSYAMWAKQDNEKRQYWYDIEQVNRDVVVFDEAHKLRNVYRDLSSDLDDFLNPDEAFDEDGNRKESWAKKLYDRFYDTKKILLTATPLQNTLLELFGMMSFVDPYTFGDLESFKEQYISQSVDENVLAELRERIQPLFHRTLRRQVADQIKYTKRIAHTIEYQWSDEEKEFYEEMSEFLRTSSLFQSKNGRVNYLIVLVYWKLLASSIPAILWTMRKLLWRLKKEKRELEKKQRIEEELNTDEDILEDSDILETYKQEAEELQIELTSWMTNVIDEVTISQLNEYIDSVDRYIKMWESITDDKKAEALLQAIEVAYTELDKLWASKKVLIFTESRRTQDYLYKYLSDNWFDKKVICFNWDNNSPETRQIYADWKKEYEWTRYYSGSKSSDTRASLVDYFKNQAEILIATESASEWVNLQFCSLMVNYDLPRNPQRVEQRIWRCHRYWQLHDVIVMNLINTENRADQRVFELLNSKLDLFQWLFWASDKVLWAIESWIDIEKTIFDIYQTCRTKEEIDTAFENIQIANKEEVESKLSQTKDKVLDYFDEDVARRLKDKKEQSKLMLNELQLALMNMILIELDWATRISDNTISVDVKDERFPAWVYTFDQKNNEWYLLRTNDDLWNAITEQSKWIEIKPKLIEFDVTNHSWRIAQLEELQWKTWWMKVSKLWINAYNYEEYLIHACIDEQGNKITEEVAKKMFRVIWKEISDVTIFEDETKKLDNLTNEIIADIQDRSKNVNEEYFTSEVDKLEWWSEDLKRSLWKQQKSLKKQIVELRKKWRIEKDLQEKINIQKKIKSKEKSISKIRKELEDVEVKIDEERERLIDDIQARLDSASDVENLFTIQRKII